MCEGRGQKVRAVFCRVIRTTSRALSLSSPVVFLNWRERQRFPTLAVSFVSLSTVLGKQQFSVLEYTSSLSLLFLSSHSLPLPHLSTRCLTSYRPAHPRVSPTSPISQCFSHPFSPIVSSLYFSFPLSVHLSHPCAPFYPTFLSSAGSQTAERLYTKAFCSSPHAAPSMTPAGCFPPCKDTHTRLFVRISSALHWMFGAVLHLTNKETSAARLILI